MPLQIKTNKRRTPQIISTDPVNFAEVQNITDDKISLRLVFNLKLQSVNYDPSLLKNVVITLLQPNQTLETNFIESDVSNKINFDEKDRVGKIAKNIESNIKLSDSFRPEYNLKKRLDPKSNQKSNETLLLVNNSSTRGQNEITSVVVPVSEKVKLSLNYPYEAINLTIPQSVKTFSDRLGTADFLDANNIQRLIISERKTPTEFISKNVNNSDTLFGRSLVQFFLNNPITPSKNFIDNLVFYQPEKTLKFLNSIDIAASIDLSTIYQNTGLIARFDVYDDSSGFPIETLTTQFNLPRYIESYYALETEPFVDVNNFDVPVVTFLSEESQTDQSKITGFNLYTKTIDKNGNSTPYALVNKIDVSDASIKQGTYSFTKEDESVFKVLRVVPVTPAGESNVFSDLVIGRELQQKANSNLAVIYSQFTDTSVSFEISNLSDDVDIIDVFKRDCTNSEHTEFKLVRKIKRNGVQETLFIDNNLVPGHFFEYYFQASNQQQVVQVSQPIMFEILRFSSSDTTTNVTVDDLTQSSVSISVNTVYKQNKQDLLETSINASGDTAAQSLFVQDTSLRNPSLSQKSIDEYRKIFFHQVIRTDSVTSERIVFDFVTDGPFIDNEDTRAINNAPNLIPGRTYFYEVLTYKRDPVTATKDYLFNGVDKFNQAWAYRPYKWKNPKVLKTGILYSDNDSNVPMIEDYEIFAADPIGTTGALKITIPSGPISTTEPNAFVEKISRSLVKISWSTSSNDYDSFVVVKVVNGKKTILGKSFKSFIYHKIESDDVGTVYYEITVIKNNLTIGTTFFSNAIVLGEDFSYKLPKMN